MKGTDGRRLISAGMCFMRQTMGYVLSDHERTEEVVRDLQIPQIMEF
jgi:hypothetical protein